MPEYPQLDVPPPPIFNQDHVRAVEDAMRQLAVADHIIKKCERCQIPVSEQRKDCDGMCEFFQRFLAEERGQGAQLPAAVR